METARQKKGSSRDGKNAVKLVPDSFVFGLGDFEKTKQNNNNNNKPYFWTHSSVDTEIESRWTRSSLPWPKSLWGWQAPPRLHRAAICLRRTGIFLSGASSFSKIQHQNQKSTHLPSLSLGKECYFLSQVWRQIPQHPRDWAKSGQTSNDTARAAQPTESSHPRRTGVSTGGLYTESNYRGIGLAF